ncbi:MAG: CBS domain-containing protein [Pseudomonadota bacterium]
MNVTQVLKLKGSAAVETIAPEATVAEAAAHLSQHRFGALVVSRDGESVAGILSERDIVRGIGQEGAAVLERPIATLMTARVETCAPGEDIDRVLSRMTAGRFRHMPVVRDGCMVGLLSIGDVVKARIFEIEEENEQMQAMLHG